MTKLLASLAAFTALTGAAAAADLPRRAAPPPVFTPVPVFTWTGFYAGFNAGYAFDASSRSNNSTFGVPAPFAVPGTTATFRNRSQDGFSGGAQIGYNVQFTPGSGVVVGIEADAQYLDFGRSRNNAFVNGAVAPGYYVTDPRGLSSLDYFGTVRGRLGYAFDRTLVYGTGGFAYGSGSADRVRRLSATTATGYAAVSSSPTELRSAATPATTASAPATRSARRCRVRPPHRVVPELLPLLGRDVHVLKSGGRWTDAPREV